MAVDITRDGDVMIVTLNRPERLNALTKEDYGVLAEAWREAGLDDEVGAVVLTGAGDRAFCTGADLYDTIPKAPRLLDLWGPMSQERVDRALMLWKPVVAAVRGYCIGGGLTLMLNTDLRVASEDAVFSLPEDRWGIPVNSAPRRLAPHAVALEWMLLGEQFGAAAAAEHGLVNRVVPAAEVLPVALDLAHRAAANPTAAVQATKELAYRAPRMLAEDADRFEESLAAVLAYSARGQGLDATEVPN